MDPSHARKQWQETEEGICGTPGMLAILEKFSISEVSMCLARFSCWQNGPDRAEKQAKVTELLPYLLSSSYPDASSQSSIQRPFRESYGPLRLGCTSTFVETAIHNGSPVEIKSQSDCPRERSKSNLSSLNYTIPQKHSVYFVSPFNPLMLLR
ncbi:hypothetical protein IFR04_004451 [Cadophora malorum]|uniref:Uncharacterized protein n=1 Tax=Cadophora malorum TaxID=108018 RepID=A0A8H7WCU5_9HELO|nr:hypothetical protein IFR04_004451 [Cadophora malorum]